MAVFKYLENMRNRHNELSQWYDRLADLYRRKLWFELTLALDEFLVSSAFQVSLNTEDPVLELYRNYFDDLKQRMNLFKLANFRFETIDASIDCLDKMVFMTMNIALLDLDMGDEEECREKLAKVKRTLDFVIEINPSVYSIFFWVLSQYHKVRREYAEFYRSALLFLSFESVESLIEPIKQDLAFDLSLSALLGDNIYNFGELLAHPIIKSLLGSEAEWIYYILEAFNAGDVDRYQELCRVHSTALNSQPALVQNEKKLSEKINILCLMDIIFSRSSEDRTIPLSIISERTKLSVEDVKCLLKKCLSVHLIEGMIDQVKGTVYVSWVQPRVSESETLDSWFDNLDL